MYKKLLNRVKNAERVVLWALLNICAGRLVHENTAEPNKVPKLIYFKVSPATTLRYDDPSRSHDPSRHDPSRHNSHHSTGSLHSSRRNRGSSLRSTHHT